MNGSIGNNIGKLISEVYLSNGDIFAPPDGETWILECDEIRGSTGYQDVYFIVRWDGDSKETGRWNISQIAGWSHIMQSRKEIKNE